MWREQMETHRPLPAERAFVIQLAHEADPTRDRFIGRVVHVTSGEEQRFESPGEALRFIRRVVAALMQADRDELES